MSTTSPARTSTPWCAATAASSSASTTDDRGRASTPRWPGTSSRTPRETKGGSFEASPWRGPLSPRCSRGVAAAVPVVVVADRDVGQRVDVGAAVRRRAEQLGHVPVADAVARTPRLGALGAQPARGARHAHPERRVRAEQRHVGEPRHRQREDLAAAWAAPARRGSPRGRRKAAGPRSGSATLTAGPPGRRRPCRPRARASWAARPPTPRGDAARRRRRSRSPSGPPAGRPPRRPSPRRW